MTIDLHRIGRVLGLMPPERLYENVLDATTAAITEWLRICDASGYTASKGTDYYVGQRYPYEVFPTAADVSHSALLRRILAGKQVFPIPPPCRHSSPWYDLAETGEGEVLECIESTRGDGPCLVLDQEVWHIVEMRSPTEYIVSYRDDAPHYRIVRTPERDHHRFKVWRIAVRKECAR